MNDTDYEIEILERERQELEKTHKKLTGIIERQMPHQRYFEILDEITKTQGTKKMSSNRIMGLVNEGAELEKNLVESTEEFRKEEEAARTQLFIINTKISFVANKLACLSYRKTRE